MAAFSNFLIFAHQGGAHEGPSSTLFAMKKALRNGANALELDVHMTKDRVLIVCHDNTVDATTNGHGKISELSLKEIKSLDGAYYFVEGIGNSAEGPFTLRGKNDNLLKLATLEEVLCEFKETVINLDIKETGSQDFNYEEELADLISEHNPERIIVASFHHEALLRFRKIAPDVYTSASPVEVAEFYQAFKTGQEPGFLAFKFLQVPHYFSGSELITPDFVEFGRKHNAAIHAWTINSYEEMVSLINTSVDGIMTDRPSLLNKALKDLKLR